MSPTSTPPTPGELEEIMIVLVWSAKLSYVQNSTKSLLKTAYTKTDDVKLPLTPTSKGLWGA